MKKVNPKPDAWVCFMSVAGLLDEIPELGKIGDELEKNLKKLAKDNNLEIRVSIQAWEIKKRKNG